CASGNRLHQLDCGRLEGATPFDASRPCRTACNHLSESRLCRLDKVDGPGKSYKNVSLVALEDGSHQHGIELRCFWSSGHAAQISSLGLHKGNFVTMDSGLFDLRLDLILRFLKLAQPTVNVRLGAPTVSLPEVIEDDLARFFSLGIGDLQLGFPHAGV